eukprot:Skav200548  [mRNA]  locus=scaffold676:489449:494409:- [translate_table: standard]
MTGMKRSTRAMLLLGAMTGALYSQAFVSPNSRRSVLSAGLLSALSLSESAKAADFLGIPSIPGPFEMKPQDAVVIGDANDAKIKEARKKVEDLQKQAEEALDKLEKDPQADLAYMITDFGIGELRLATNAINDIMDDKTAAATQRWQRLMIQVAQELGVAAAGRTRRVEVIGLTMDGLLIISMDGLLIRMDLESNGLIIDNG